jgi:outer membrane protein assembly factor BamB
MIRLRLAVMATVLAGLSAAGPVGQPQAPTCQYGQGFAACPGGVLFLMKDGVLSAIDASAGRVQWQLDFGASTFSTDLAITDEIVAVATGTAYPDRIDGVSRLTGHKVWTVPSKRRTLQLTAAGGNVIASDASGEVVGLDGRNGMVSWRLPGASSVGFWGVFGDGVLTGSFRLDGRSGRIECRWLEPGVPTELGSLRLVGSQAGRVTAYRADCSRAWSVAVPDGQPIQYLDGAGGVVVGYSQVPSQRDHASLFTISGDGEVLWSKSLKLAAPLLGPIGVSSGLVLVVTHNDRTGGSLLTAYDSRTGDQKWTIGRAVPFTAGRHLACDADRCYLLSTSLLPHRGAAIIGVEPRSGSLAEFVSLPNR